MSSQQSNLNLSLFISPSLLFIMELTAWLWLLVIGITVDPVYVILFIVSLSVMATMNYTGDKKHDGPISVPGWLRIFNELFFAGLLSVFGAYLLFGVNGLIVQLIIVILVIIFDFPRYLWMLGFKKNPPAYVTMIRNNKK